MAHMSPHYLADLPPGPIHIINLSLINLTTCVSLSQLPTYANLCRQAKPFHLFVSSFLNPPPKTFSFSSILFYGIRSPAFDIAIPWQEDLPED